MVMITLFVNYKACMKRKKKEFGISIHPFSYAAYTLIYALVSIYLLLFDAQYLPIYVYIIVSLLIIP